jgi:hypothetical protein
MGSTEPSADAADRAGTGAEAALTGEAAQRYHDRTDPHGRGASIPDVLLGGQDGLVNVLGVLLGVAVATKEPRVLVAAGLATAFSEAISMAAVAYTSSLARDDLYAAEWQRELRHVRRVPEVERQEVRAFFERKGIAGPVLDQLVMQLTAVGYGAGRLADVAMP